LSSTLGFLILLANREETEGAWIDFKKPVLADLPVLNVLALSGDQLLALTTCYDETARESLQPFPQMANDRVRAQIDAAVAKAFKLPDFSILRTLLAHEPVVCLNRL